MKFEIGTEDEVPKFTFGTEDFWVDCSELLERRFAFAAEFRLFLMREVGTFLRIVIEDSIVFFSFRPTRATVLRESQD